MVNVIDLLDDSSDDEIESRPTMPTKKPSVTQSDDDNEVLWIPKPIAYASSSNKNNATINSKQNSSTRRSSVLDSDDESDDDFLLSSLPGGLSWYDPAAHTVAVWQIASDEAVALTS